MSGMTDEQYMQQALKEAQKAFDAGEVPVGAIVVMNNQIIARAHNQVEDRKSTRLNSSHPRLSRMPSSA